MEAPSLTPSLLIAPQGWTVPIAPGQSLLEAAQTAGVRLPRSCRNGSCRACRCKLLQGQVSYRVDWPGLLAEEKAEGWILPCVALPAGDVTSDLVIEAPFASQASPLPRR